MSKLSPMSQHSSSGVLSQKVRDKHMRRGILEAKQNIRKDSDQAIILQLWVWRNSIGYSLYETEQAACSGVADRLQDCGVGGVGGQDAEKSCTAYFAPLPSSPLGAQAERHRMARKLPIARSLLVAVGVATLGTPSRAQVDILLGKFNTMVSSAEHWWDVVIRTR
jgi:hypothetical protein